MSCKNVQELISLLLDQKLSAGERENVLAHLKSCWKCGLYLESVGSIRSHLREMPEPILPARVAAKLRVIASHERQRVIARRSLSARAAAWVGRIELAFDNLMRPFAVPVAGGLLSALILFCVLVPNLSFAHNFTDRSFFTSPMGLAVEQVPMAGDAVVNSTQSFRIESVDAEMPTDARVVVELTIDASGRVSDYYVTRGTLTPDVQSIIMLGKFIPATNLGIPVTGKVRIVQVSGWSVRG
jgi:anti-sigma factor RsiW